MQTLGDGRTERAADEAQAEQGQIDRAAILAEIRALRVEIAELAGTSDRPSRPREN